MSMQLPHTTTKPPYAPGLKLTSRYGPTLGPPPTCTMVMMPTTLGAMGLPTTSEMHTIQCQPSGPVISRLLTGLATYPLHPDAEL